MIRPEKEPGSKMGPYRVGECLGQGGMGVVYRAFDERLQRPVALKQIRPEALENELAHRRFRREARTAGRLTHPAIVQIYDFFKAEGCEWIVMELVEGRSLARLLESGPLPLRRALEIGAEIAEALFAAHSEGIVHRDLKSSNVLATGDGRVRVLDFGLAKQVVRSEDPSTSISATGQLLGTPRAMSPEQAMGRKVDSRSDLFSLGSLLYELISGSPPFRAADPLETMARVCQYHPLPLRERDPRVPEPVSELVERLLEKDPVHRPRSASRVASLLRRFADGLARPEQRSGLAAPAARPAQDEAAEASTVAAPARPGSESGSHSRGERRQVTLLCCELVSTDSSSEALDPDALYASSAELERLAREVSDGFEGFLTHALGHRLTVYFGYPRAQEDAARRAVAAALELQRRIAEPAFADLGKKLALRCVIHTGPAVVLGDSATGSEQLAMGRDLDLANALLRSAPPDEVRVTSATRMLLKDAFRLESCEAVNDRGQPERVFNVFATVADAADWETVDPPTPLVGREGEVELLRDRWRLARRGEGQVVLLRGEAGIGKTRLAQAILEAATERGGLALKAVCSSLTRRSPFKPLIDLLYRTLRLGAAESPVDDLARLENELAVHGLSENDAPALLGAFLSLPTAERYPPRAMAPKVRREMTLGVLQELFLAMANRQPMVFLVEDVHWIDPSTLDFLNRLIDRVASSPILLLLTFRPELDSPWPERPHLTRLSLGRLPVAAVTEMIDELTGGRALPAAVRGKIIARTDGIPLFAEELIRDLLESDALIARKDRYELGSTIDELIVPATLRDSLAARLDRLGTAKEIAQTASVIGREFALELLRSLSGVDVPTLDQELDRLVAAGLLRRRGFGSRSRFLFKHALIHDTAYSSMIEARKKELHGQTANALLDGFKELASRQPELVAHHFSQAGLDRPAIDYWLLAGRKAIERVANLEAIDHFSQGLDRIESLSESTERDRLELDLRTAVGPALNAVKGYAAAEVERNYAHAKILCEKLGETTQLFWSLWGLQTYHLIHANVDQAFGMGQNMVELAELELDASYLAEAHGALGLTQLFRGDFSDSLEHLETSLELSRLDEESSHVFITGHELTVTSRAYAAPSLWVLGFPDQALETAREAVAAARNHPFSLALALYFNAWIHQLRGERTSLFEIADRLTALCEEKGFLWWKHQVNIMVGWGHVEAGETSPENEKWIEHTRKSYEAYCSTGTAIIPKTYLMSLVVEAYDNFGDSETAGRYLDEIESIYEKARWIFWKSEICRLRGTLLLARGDGVEAASGKAERLLRKALEIARGLKAKSFELRAATDLARCLHRKGDSAAAYDLLCGAYERLGEGHDTADLRAARALITLLR